MAAQRLLDAASPETPVSTAPIRETPQGDEELFPLSPEIAELRPDCPAEYIPTLQETEREPTV